MSRPSAEQHARPLVDETRSSLDLGVASEGDFEVFYRNHYRSVVSIVVVLSGRTGAAEELAQDAFVKAHRHWPELATHPNREAWVKRVAINLARSSTRRAMVEARVLTRLSRERPKVEAMPEPAHRVWEVVRALPKNQAIAITLRYHDDQSIEQIADVLGCSPATVRVHLHRGRRTIADRLELEDDSKNQES